MDRKREFVTDSVLGAYYGTMDAHLFETWFQKFLCPAFATGKVFIKEAAVIKKRLQNAMTYMSSLDDAIAFCL